MMFQTLGLWNIYLTLFNKISMQMYSSVLLRNDTRSRKDEYLRLKVWHTYIVTYQIKV